jgi:hypothetical protein
LLWSLFLWPVIFVSCHFSFFSNVNHHVFHRIFILWRWRKRGWVDCGESLSEMKSQSDENRVQNGNNWYERANAFVSGRERERERPIQSVHDFTVGRRCFSLHFFDSLLLPCSATLGSAVYSCTVNTLVVSLPCCAFGDSLKQSNANGGRFDTPINQESADETNLGAKSWNCFLAIFGRKWWKKKRTNLDAFECV